MKKTYNQPTCIVVELNSRNALMSVSGTGTLDGTSSGGGTKASNVTECDVKEIGDVNVWDEEW